MALKRDKIDVAEAIVSEILRKDSRNTNALKVRASVRIVRGQLDLAITDLQQALNDQPRSTRTHIAIGACIRAQRIDGACRQTVC